MTRLMATVAAVLMMSVSAAAASASVSAERCVSPQRWKGLQKANWVQSCEVCRAFGVRAVRSEYRVRAADPAGVALGFARASMRPRFQQAAFEGCLRGFRLRA